MDGCMPGGGDGGTARGHQNTRRATPANAGGEGMAGSEGAVCRWALLMGQMKLRCK